MKEEKKPDFKDYVNENFEKELQFSDDEVKAYLASDNEKAKAIAENIKKDTDAITAKYEGEGVTKPTYDKLSQNDKILYFDKEVYTKATDGMSEEDYIKAFAAKGGENAAKALNKANIENNLSALSFKDESVNIKAVVNDDGTITIKGVGQLTGLDREFAITADAANKTDFGIDKTDLKGISGQTSTSDKLSQLGLSADAKGNYNFKINGVQFSFEGDTTIKDMMKKVNASDAGVTMTYTSLTNQFTLTTKDYGIGQNITFEDGSEGLLGALGFSAGATTFIDGKNTSLNVNGVDVETSSNSYTVDGTTFTFTSAAEGTSFTNTVSRDYSKAVAAIKGFIEDYNKLIDEVYGYVDDEPNGNYHFLTDDDKETMNLSESQEEKWEKLAKKGILYRDASLSGIMSKLRAAVYSSVEAPDGKNIGLFSLGITTGNNRKDHGKLLLDPSVTDEMLADKFAKYADEFEKLFNSTEKVNGSERGIAYQFDNIINSAVKVSGDPKERGVLVQKAGVSGTSSATTNVIYDQIKSLKNTIDTLKDRYQKQQDRFWKMYANMETNLGKINGQSSYIQQLMGSM